MAQSIINCDRLAEADAIIFGAPYERSASFGVGAAAGPEAIVNCLERQIEFFERRTRTEPARLFKIAHRMLTGIETLSPASMVDRIASELSRHDALCVILGGVHSVSIGALQALARKYDPANVTVLQIDAHLDMRRDDSDYNDVDPSPYAHCCVMRRAVELGYRTCSVGTRAYSEDECRFAAQNALPFFEWGLGEHPTTDAIIASVETDLVYITIDADGLDPSVAPATGTPVPSGLSWDYCTALLERAVRDKTAVGFDIVEVAPTPGQALTEYVAAQLCYNLIGHILLKKTGNLRFL